MDEPRCNSCGMYVNSHACPDEVAELRQIRDRAVEKRDAALLQNEGLTKVLTAISRWPCECTESSNCPACQAYAALVVKRHPEKRKDEPRKSGCYVNGIQVGHEWVKGDIYTKCRLCNTINMDV